MNFKASSIFRSVRFRVLLWYVLILTITLLAFSALIYGSFNKILIDELDDLLYSKADGVAKSILAYRQHSVVDNQSFIEPAKLPWVAVNWIEERRKDPELMSIFTQVLDLNGKVLLAAKGMPKLYALDEEDLKDLADGDESFDSMEVPAFENKRVKFRACTIPVIEGGKTIYIVQTAGPISLLSLALTNLMVVLFILLPLTLILAAVPGFLLVRLTLKPVDKMIETLKHITTENLKLRIHIPDTHDEIKRLADTFNGMIDRLDRSFTSQQRFVQDVAHELKAPITILKGEIEALLREDSPIEGYASSLMRMRDEINLFSNTIENLLVLSKKEDLPPALELKKVDLGWVSDDIVREMRHLAAEKGIKINSSISGKIILDADEDEVKRLLINLIDNAVKYSYRNGHVDVNTSLDGGFASIVISDSGAGIDAEDIPYIFDKFYQAAKSRNSKDGFGLGLNVVKSIIDQHKGTISVTSQPGKGSTFTVKLPLSYPA